MIVSYLGLEGFRIGTLVTLRYRYVKRGLEKGIVSILVHVENGITKGKYHDYDTLLGNEVAVYIRGMHASVMRIQHTTFSTNLKSLVSASE